MKKQLTETQKTLRQLHNINYLETYARSKKFFKKENEEIFLSNEESYNFEGMNKKEKEIFWEIKKRKSYFILYKQYPKEFSSINLKLSQNSFL